MPSFEARITSVEEDTTTGWYRIGTDHETYKRLDTKVAEKAKEAADLKKTGLLALVEYSEKEGNVNPHTGRPYLNRYYERAGAIEDPEPEDDGITRVVPTRRTDPLDAWRISLAAGAKLAVATLPLMPPDQRTFEIQKRIAFAWARYLYFTTAPEAEFSDLAGEPEPDPEAEGIPF